jgi:hypothetical protein
VGTVYKNLKRTAELQTPGVLVAACTQAVKLSAVEPVVDYIGQSIETTVQREKMNDAVRDVELLANSPSENRETLPDYEIRRLGERAEEYLGAPPPWEVVGYAPTRQYACIIAEALNRQHGWEVEVWVLRNNVEPDTGTELPAPMRTDRFEESEV